MMPFTVTPCPAEDLVRLRRAFVREMACQVVHDSIHVRPGWSVSYRIRDPQGRGCAGYGSIAIAGPWKDRPTIYEFHLAPAVRHRAFEAFEAFLGASGARHFEVQTNNLLLAVMLHTYGTAVESEKILFRDGMVTRHPSQGARLRPTGDSASARRQQRMRQGGPEWVLELDGAPVGRGGFLFHYNRPYADIYMEVDQAHRRRGLGTYLVQELKRHCRNCGAEPSARCSPANTASVRTLQKAGLTPHGHILLGNLREQR